MDTKESGRSVEPLKPDWFDQVTEVDINEARVLAQLGVDCWLNEHTGTGWLYGLQGLHVSECDLSCDVTAGGSPEFFYVMKGEPLP